MVYFIFIITYTQYFYKPNTHTHTHFSFHLLAKTKGLKTVNVPRDYSIYLYPKLRYLKQYWQCCGHWKRAGFYIKMLIISVNVAYKLYSKVIIMYKHSACKFSFWFFHKFINFNLPTQFMEERFFLRSECI